MSDVYRMPRHSRLDFAHASLKKAIAMLEVAANFADFDMRDNFRTLK